MPERGGRMPTSDGDGRFAALFAGSADAILLKDERARIMDWNAAAERLYGYAAAEVIGRSVAMLVPPDRAGEELRILARVLAGEHVGHYVTERVRADGSRVAVSLTVSAVRAPDGQVVGASSSARDITRQRAEAAERHRLASLVDASPDAIVALAPDGVVLRCNRAAQRLLGVAAADAVGRRIDVIAAAGESSTERARRLARVFAHGEIVRYEAERDGADGRPLTLLVTLSPVYDGDGAITAACVVCRDVSEQRRIERRLRDAERMESIGRLAGGVAHDFNNLLTVIGGYAALAQRAIGDGGRGASELDEVQRAAGRAADVTRRLLEFSRRTDVQPVPLDLSEIVHDVLPMLERLIGEQIRMVALTDPHVARTLADRPQIGQVLLDLAANARDAMPDGGTLTIETHTVTLTGETDKLPAGRYACLTVTDTGTGIDPATIEHVFEPFFTTKDAGAGTGLGLASVHGIVTRTGGHVRVYSEPGMGACFRIYLPASDQPATPPPSAPTQTPTHKRGSGETVLICEDEEPVRRLLAETVTAAGYAAEAVGTPAEALEAVSSGTQPDAIISDIIMPGRTGPELIDQLTAHIGSVPVLFISGYTRHVTTSRIALPSRSDFLTKPFSTGELLERLAALLAQRATSPPR
jgi:two-component system, cell cycle sensor histidine kinase and response regulator CckA